MSQFKLVVSIIISVIIVNILILWTFQIHTQDQLNQLRPLPEIKPASINQAQPASSPAPFSAETLTGLKTDLADLTQKLDNLETQVSNLSLAPATTTVASFSPQVIYLGSATTNKRDWTDSGIEVTLNTADYPADVNAVFTAGLSIVGGEAWARLRNKTTGSIMSITEVFHNNSNVTWKSSPDFKLHSGYNNYVVQLRSSSGETVNLSGARLRISR